MGHFMSLIVAILVVLNVLTAHVCAEERVALVIGNGTYQKVAALSNPPNDASDVAASLERLGFSVKKLLNAKFDDMRRGLLNFGRHAGGTEMAVVFFAGHGMEIGGENWLIPVDAELRNDTDAENEAISLKTVMLQVASARNLGLVILDSCRNNPFAAKMQRTIRVRAVSRGLARTEPLDNVLVAYAAKDGTTANDGTGRNSPFTAALLKNLETPGLEITFMFRNIRDDVMAATIREQQPFVYGSLSKEAIFFKPPVLSTITPVPSADEVFWNAIKDSNVHTLFDEFVRKFPASLHAADARRRAEELKKALGPTLSPSPSPPQATNAIGCFRDQGDDTGTRGRDLNGFVTHGPNMTTAACINECQQRGFAYAGTQYSSWCFCGNSYGRSGPSNSCNMPCSGSPAEFCGGVWANSVYKVVQQPVPTSTPPRSRKR